MVLVILKQRGLNKVIVVRVAIYIVFLRLLRMFCKVKNKLYELTVQA